MKAFEFAKFTFHYASTLSCVRIVDIGEWSSFTFHYASTLSRLGVVFSAGV